MRRRPARQQAPTYSLIDELSASPTKPMPADHRLHQLTRMWQGLAAIEQAPAPTTADWRVVSDAVNLMETLVEMGVLQDGQGLLADAVTGMAAAGKRGLQGGVIRLDKPGMLAVRAILEDYAEAIAILPARVMVRAHRKTESRIREILSGLRRPHDVEVVDL